jgi:hypothetical protein
VLLHKGVTADLGVNTEGGQSWLEIIAHGMGAYFIGKGLLLAPQTWNIAEQLRYRIADEHDDQPKKDKDDYSGLPAR